MKKFLFIISAVVLIFASFYFNDLSAEAFKFLREKTLSAEQGIIFFTGMGVFLIIGAIAVILFAFKRHRILVLTVVSLLSALAIGYVLKQIFHVPRPEFDVRGLIMARDYSFPSMHTIGAVSVLPFTFRITKNAVLRVFFALLMISIVLSRLYLGVHRLSDVVFGAILGILIGIYMIVLEDEYKIADKIIEKLKTDLEVRRQIVHLLTGILIAAFIFYGFINIWMFLAVLVIGGVFSLILKYKKIPLLTHLLCYFDRECDIKRFPGKGLIYMIAGSALAYVLFSKNIAIAGILVLAFGDSLTHVIGKYLGRIKSPFDKTKYIEGTIVAFFITALMIMKFVSFNQMILGTLIAMVVEMIPLKIWKFRIDDNLIIPVLAGAVMSLL